MFPNDLIALHCLVSCITGVQYLVNISEGDGFDETLDHNRRSLDKPSLSSHVVKRSPFFHGVFIVLKIVGATEDYDQLIVMTAASPRSSKGPS